EIHEAQAQEESTRRGGEAEKIAQPAVRAGREHHATQGERWEIERPRGARDLEEDKVFDAQRGTRPEYTDTDGARQEMDQAMFHEVVDVPEALSHTLLLPLTNGGSL